MADMWNQVTVTALLSLLGVSIGAALQYYFGRALEGRKQLALQRSQAYVDYFKAVALIAKQGVSKDNLAMAADAKVRVCMYGSAQVIGRLSAFEAKGAIINSDESASVVMDLLKEMRRDTGMDVESINESDLRAILAPPASFQGAKARG